MLIIFWHTCQFQPINSNETNRLKALDRYVVRKMNITDKIHSLETRMKIYFNSTVLARKLKLLFRILPLLLSML
jgi:hypothetical protein